ncbi:unnamed protein product [Laminaria digitata]
MIRGTHSVQRLVASRQAQNEHPFSACNVSRGAISRLCLQHTGRKRRSAHVKTPLLPTNKPLSLQPIFLFPPFRRRKQEGHTRAFNLSYSSLCCVFDLLFLDDHSSVKSEPASYQVGLRVS